MKTVWDHIKQYPSVAADSGSSTRTAQHFITRVVNTINLKMEISNTQATLALIDPSFAELCDRNFTYVHAWDAVAYVARLRAARKQSDLEDDGHVSSDSDNDVDDDDQQIADNSSGAHLFQMLDKSKLPVEEAHLYALRGPDLAILNLDEYRHLIEWVPFDVSKESAAAAAHHGAGRPKNGTFHFDRRSPLATCYIQKLRSKYPLAILSGRAAPSDMTEPASIAFFMTLLCPWDYDSLPPMELQSFSELLRQETDQGSKLSRGRWDRLSNVLRSLHVPTETKQAMAIYRGRMRHMWTKMELVQIKAGIFAGGQRVSAIDGKSDEERRLALELGVLSEKSFLSGKQITTAGNRQSYVNGLFKELVSTGMGLSSDELQLQLSSSSISDIVVPNGAASVPFSSAVIHTQSSDEANAIAATWASEPVQPTVQPTNNVRHERDDASAVDFVEEKRDLEIDKLCRGLTAEQSAVVLVYVDYFKAKLKDPRAKPPNILMLGGPGTGKSFVVDLLVSKIVPLFESHMLGTARICSPFGGAAALFKDGRTTHSMFMFTQPGARGANGDNSPLKDQLLKPLSAKNLLICGARLGILSDGSRPALIVLDEVSLFSAIGVSHIHQRLCQLTGSSEPFGGLPILFSGDFRQIDPVGGIPLFQDALFYDGLDMSKPSAIGTKLITEEFKCMRINEQKRCEEDPVHAAQVAHLGAGKPLTREIISSWKELTPEDVKTDPSWRSAVLFVTSNAEVSSLNLIRAIEWASAHDTFVIRWPVTIVKSSKAKGNIMWHALTSERRADMLFDSKNSDLWCFFVAGAPGFLDSNIQPCRGLANGSPFKYHSLTYASETDSEAVLTFAQTRGQRLVLTMPSPPQFVNVIIQRGNNSEDGLNIPAGDVLVNPNTEVIVPVGSSAWTSITEAVPPDEQLRPWQLTVKTFPLQLGFALTFHKVQSKTIAKGILVLGKRLFLPTISLPMLFVGMSRFKSAADMRVLNPVAGTDLFYLLKLTPDPIIDHWLSGIQENGMWLRPLKCPWKNRADYKKSLKSKPVKVQRPAGQVKPVTVKPLTQSSATIPALMVVHDERHTQQFCAIVNGFEFSIFARDICLNPRGWLNAELIDSCMNFRGNHLFPASDAIAQQLQPQVCILSCTEINRKNLIDKFGCMAADSIVVVPLNHDLTHWSVAILVLETRVVYHLDSLSLEIGDVRPALQHLASWIDDFICTAPSAAVVNPVSIIQLETTRQPNAYDCGLHVIIHVRELLRSLCKSGASLINSMDMDSIIRTTASSPSSTVLQSVCALRGSLSAQYGKISNEHFRFPPTVQRRARGITREAAIPAPGMQQVAASTIGIANDGNTCFINSNLQAIFSLTSFMNNLAIVAQPDASLVPHSKNSHSQKNISIMRLLVSLSEDLKKRRGVCSAQGIKQLVTVSQPQYKGRLQHDAHEFFTHLLDEIQLDYASSARANLPQQELSAAFTLPTTHFLFPVLKTMRCTDCHYSRSNPYSFQSLSLPLPPANVSKILSVHDLLTLYFAQNEEVEYRCDKCPGKICRICNFEFSPGRQAVQCDRVQMCPRVLVLQIKRFEFHQITQRSTKRSDAIALPESLDISDFCAQEMESRYTLRSVLYHHGETLRSGHFTSRTRSNDGSWWVC